MRRGLLAYAAGRTGYALALLTAPRPLGSAWVGDDGSRPAVQVAMRGLAARDLIGSLGVARAAARGDDPRPWLALCVAGDIADAGATLLARRGLESRRVALTALVAGGSAVAGAALGVAAGRR